MEKYKIAYTVFDNFQSHKIIDISDGYDFIFTQTIKLIVWNMIKDDEWDWPVTYDNLSIDKVNKI